MFLPDNDREQALYMAEQLITNGLPISPSQRQELLGAIGTLSPQERTRLQNAADIRDGRARMAERQNSELLKVWNRFQDAFSRRMGFRG